MHTVIIEDPSDSSDDLDELAGLWMELHAHQLTVATYAGLNRDLEAGWPRRRAHYELALATGGAIIRARVDRRLVGYCAMGVRPGADETWETTGVVNVITLVVTASMRSQGIGTQLLDAATSFARANGCDVLELEVMPGNDKARRLYEQSGFEAAEVVLHRRLA